MKLILTLVTVIASVLLITSIFSTLGQQVSLINGINSSGVPNGGSMTLPNSSVCSCGVNTIRLTPSLNIQLNDSLPTALFRIIGVTGSNYVRTVVAERYSNGEWFIEPSDTLKYNGRALDIAVPSGFVTAGNHTIQIQPIMGLQSFLPAFKNAYFLALYPLWYSTDLTYYPQYQSFYSKIELKTNYNVSYWVYSFSNESLNSATTVSNSNYLVPEQLYNELKALTEGLTGNLTTPYAKAKAIEIYLRTNYQYSFNISQAPSGIDPVEWFLFHDKKGVCVHFNTAFVLMARTVGLPARLVLGFLVDDANATQVVTNRNAHAYSEVYFNDLGWITFDATASDRGAADGDGGGKGGGATGNAEKIGLPRGPITPSYSPVLFIEGVTGSPYLRDNVGEIYSDGAWSLIMPIETINYYGGVIDQTLPAQYSGVESHTVSIKPLVPLYPRIPSFQYTAMLRFLPPYTTTDLNYSPEHQTFRTETSTNSSYQVQYGVYSFTYAVLSDAHVTQDGSYLDVPQSIYAQIRELALNASSGATSAYDKAVALESYVRNNYVYSFNITPVPDGMDPIIWFLFHDKKGVCVDFNTAFVLMARTLGLPARTVGGYSISPTAQNQTVLAYQSHCYSEILFEGLGWVPFDATGSGPSHFDRPDVPGLIKTSTNITSVEPILLKGRTFTVNGNVLAANGSRVDNLYVQIILTESKDKNGTIVGLDRVNNGTFAVQCIIPTNFTLGSYHIIANTLGNGIYNRSNSDPVVTVMSETAISFNAPQKSLIGRQFWVNGSLIEAVTGKGLPNMTITVMVGSQVIATRTDANGSFSALAVINSFGTFSINASFVGGNYYQNSSSSSSIKIPYFSIMPITQDLVRGEGNPIMVRVLADEIPADGLALTASIGGEVLANSLTDRNGFVNAYAYVSIERPIGYTQLDYRLIDFNVSASQQVKVMGRTSIASELTVGDRLDLTARLIDDHLVPVQNQTLGASVNSSQTPKYETTNSSGYIQIFFDMPDPATTRSVSYSVRFNGSEFLIESESSGTASIPPPPINSMMNMLLIAAVMGIFTVPTALLVARRKKSKVSYATIVAPATVAPTLATSSKSTPTESWHFEIKFPQIPAELPRVWGVGEPLEVAIKHEYRGSEDVTLHIDETVEAVPPESGVIEKRQLLSKGAHKIWISVKGNTVVGEDVRIVDYKEEIVSLYNQFYGVFKRSNPSIADEMTAREFESAAKNILSEEKHRVLGELVLLFEVANYSLHEIKREHYVRTYLCIKELEADASSE